MGNWNCQIKSFLTKKNCYFPHLTGNSGCLTYVWMQHLYGLVCMRCIFYLLICQEWPAVKWNDISCWWMSPRGLFWPGSCDMCPVISASCRNSLLLAQEWNFKYKLHCRNPITSSLTVKIDGKKKVIIWECSSWSCKSNSLPSAGERCLNTDGSTQTKTRSTTK